MRRKLIVLAVLGVALSTPGAFATAGHAAVGCSARGLSEPTTTGQDVFEGMAVGYIIGDAGESVSVRCVVKVNGAVRAATSWGAGMSVATSADRVTYVRTLTETTQLCAQYVTSHGPGETCFATTTMQMPSQEVQDALRLLADLAVDAANSLHPCVTAVNLGTCNSGVCLVNTGTCDGGFCVVNTDYCGRGCVAVANAGTCGVPRVTVWS